MTLIAKSSLVRHITTDYKRFAAKYHQVSRLKLLAIIFITSVFVELLLLNLWKTLNRPAQSTNLEAPRESVLKQIPLPLSSTPSPEPTDNEKKIPQLIFGMGSEADGAEKTNLVREAPVKMLTSWYNGPSDLEWMTGWKNNLVPRLYSEGYTLHLIVFTEKPEGEVATSAGPACGREYPVSTRILDDMKKLATTFAGEGRLYVTLFTEFQTYPCEDNKWVGSENYYKALKANYYSIKDIFHQHAPNARVGISWGGWQSRWDDVEGGGGRSLIPYFADLMKDSDIVAFQAMESGSNVDDIRNMTHILGTYGKPVILSHYKPDNRSQDTFDADMRSVLTQDYLNDLTSHGLIALSFMDSDNMDQDAKIYQFIKSAIIKYAK